jgi:hypothetical protein
MNRIGDTALVAIPPRTPHGHTQVGVSIATLFVIGALNGSGVIPSGHLQESDAPFYATDQKVAAKLVLL